MLDNLTSALLNIFCRAKSGKIFMCFYRNHFDSSPSAYIGHFWAKTTQFGTYGYLFWILISNAKIKTMIMQISYSWDLWPHHPNSGKSRPQRNWTNYLSFDTTFVKSNPKYYFYWVWSILSDLLELRWYMTLFLAWVLSNYDNTTWQPLKLSKKLLLSIKFEENLQNWCCCFQ